MGSYLARMNHIASRIIFRPISILFSQTDLSVGFLVVGLWVSVVVLTVVDAVMD